MSDIKLECLLDVASPNAYLIRPAVADLEERLNVRFTIVPVLLGGLHKLTNNQPPWMTFADVPAKMDYDRLEMQRYMKKWGIDKWKMNPNFPINTLTLMRGYIASANLGVGSAYASAVLQAIWKMRRTWAMSQS